MVEEDSKEEANTVGGDASKPVGGVVRGKQFVPKKKDHEIGMCLACRMCAEKPGLHTAPNPGASVFTLEQHRLSVHRGIVILWIVCVSV